MPEPEPVAIVDPAYWLEHIDELIDGLQSAARIQEVAGPDTLVLAEKDTYLLFDPAWWAAHRDELQDALRTALREHVDERAGQKRSWLDVGRALKDSVRRPPDREPDRAPEDRDHER